MGLRDTIKNLVDKTVTSSIGDLKSTAVFRSITTGTYNATTGAVSRSVTSYTCQCVLSSVRQHDVEDLGVVASGVKVLVPVLQLEDVDVDALDDEVDIDGVKYKVHSAKRDPAGALWVFICTAKQGVKLSGD